MRPVVIIILKELWKRLTGPHAEVLYWGKANFKGIKAELGNLFGSGCLQVKGDLVSGRLLKVRWGDSE